MAKSTQKPLRTERVLRLFRNEGVKPPLKDPGLIGKGILTRVGAWKRVADDMSVLPQKLKRSWYISFR